MPRQHINSRDDVPITGFSQAMHVECRGYLLMLSGLTSRQADGTIVALDDMGGQTRQILENMKTILEEEGSSLDDVVQIRTFTTDITKWDEIEPVWREYWGKVWPVSTIVEISRLFDERQMIEMEAIAHVLQP